VLPGGRLGRVEADPMKILPLKYSSKQRWLSHGQV
jgi:hypothetical protein